MSRNISTFNTTERLVSKKNENSTIFNKLKLRYHCSGLVTYRGLAVTSGKIHSILIRTLKCALLRCEKAPMPGFGTGRRRSDDDPEERDDEGGRGERGEKHWERLMMSLGTRFSLAERREKNHCRKALT